MLSRTIGALVICGNLALGIAAYSQSSAPCRATEPPPRNGESNPTTRHVLVTHGDGSGNDREVTAETCLVVGINDKIQPGGNYSVPSYGLFFDWGLAIVGDNGRIVDIAGTVSRTGAIQGGDPATLALPLELGWNLAPNEPNPVTNRLFTQVAVWPCTTAPPGCAPDQGKQVEMTRLLGSPDRTGYVPAPAPANEPIGCFAPIKQGHDPELRQVTVVGISNQYLIFTCLVSDKYESFQSAGFTAVPIDASGNPAALAGGNTRQNIGPLHAQSWSGVPRLITLLAVQVQSSALIAPPIKKANITYSYTGCLKDDETKCDPQVQVGTVSGGVQQNPVSYDAEFYQK